MEPMEQRSWRIVEGCPVGVLRITRSGNTIIDYAGLSCGIVSRNQIEEAACFVIVRPRTSVIGCILTSVDMHSKGHLCALAVVCLVAAASATKRFEVADTFKKDGKPLQIISGRSVQRDHAYAQSCWDLVPQSLCHKGYDCSVT